MIESKHGAAKCDRCGALLAPGALEGLCPRCLMELNFRPTGSGLTRCSRKLKPGGSGRGMPTDPDRRGRNHRPARIGGLYEAQ
jgi:hypothetical protein